jgi:hypothetical protein
MNEPLRHGNPENQATACDKFRLLKQEYESTLREEALYRYGGGASVRQAIRYESGAIDASAEARDRLITHYKVCPRCTANRTQP